MKRIVFIDVAKALCIILVVVGHYFPDNSPGWYVALHDVIYTFHMPLFMFASGYVYIATGKDVPYGTFLLKKVRRLMVPYLTVSVIVITIKLLAQGGMSVDSPVTPLSYLKMFYLPEAGYFLWFIWALWWMFVLVPLFRTPRSRLCLFAACLLLHYVPAGLPQEFCLAQFKNMLVFFMLGVVAFECGRLHTFVDGFSPVKSVVAIMLFVVVQSVKLSAGVKLWQFYCLTSGYSSFSKCRSLCAATARSGEEAWCCSSRHHRMSYTCSIPRSKALPRLCSASCLWIRGYGTYSSPKPWR